ncbi:PIG-L deacetylase family protein [Streptomyces sp. NPDC057638]|uniref:PIG-L deacetylase family protein n=1 Tax=Streptomyces sp. NPDC057638 TaxID=3346190 RepID=UPI0036764049
MTGSGERVVAVVAHPDDAELLAYGTLRRYRQSGAEVTVVTATHGGAGVSLTDAADGARIGHGQRMVETAAAWAGTGVDVTGLGLADGALRADRDLITLIEQELAHRSCTTLITHSPRARNDHQDHLAIGTAAHNAATRLPQVRTVLFGQPHAPGARFTPTVAVDITPFLNDKITALARHRTQGGRWYLDAPYTRHRAADTAWRLRPHAAAEGHGFEGFETPLLTLLHHDAKETSR